MAQHPCTRAPGPRVAPRCLAAAAVVSVLVAVLTGNVFALHAGMADPLVAAPHRIAVDGVRVADGAGQGRPSALPADQSARALNVPGRGPARGAGQHLLHVLGACLAVLAAAVLLLTGLGGSLRRGEAWTAPYAGRAVAPVPRFAWRPPPLSPATSSPVIRQ